MEHIVKILEINTITHDVKSFKVERPASYSFVPGQATELSINKPNWKEEKRPFTFTSLDKDPFLEFTIKGYSDHKGVTNQLHQLIVGDELIIGDVWGAIEYKGPGYFIAGGAGITPFIAILRHLALENKLKGNRLLFSNKTSADIIYEKELTEILGKDAVYILTQEEIPGYKKGYIDEAFLLSEIKDFYKNFYVCGPDKMISDINNILIKHGAKPDAVIFEK
ncbi:MAG TPA: FAD-binding oxidoreductase [Cytophagales bacterium]|nr:FAD-binding oxidoreductase [Cytophagales bacterium]